MNEYLKKMQESRKQLLKLSVSSEKELAKLYRKLARNISREIRFTRITSNQEQYLKRLKKITDANLLEVQAELKELVSGEIQEAAQISFNLNAYYYERITDDIGILTALKDTSMASTRNTVRKMIQDRLYSDKKSLSERLWIHTSKNMESIDTVIKLNVLQGANANTLALNLEKYINPSNKLNSIIDIVTMPDGSKKKIVSNVSYNSKRLARTSINHAYTNNTIACAKSNPLNIGVKWNLSASHSMKMHGKTDICDEYANNDSYGLGVGVFPPEKCPIDHPNGMCFLTESNIDITTASKRIKAWANGGTDEDLEKWYNEVYKKVV